MIRPAENRVKEPRRHYSEKQPGDLRRDLILAGSLGLAGVLASYASVNIPHSELFIDGRQVFAFMAFALLHRLWLAILVMCAVALSGHHEIGHLSAFLANLAHLFPQLVVIRFVHARWLTRLSSLTLYAAGWGLLVMACYQVFSMPIIGVIFSFLRDAPLLPTVLEAMVRQELLLESVLAAIVSGAGMTVARLLRKLAWHEHELDVTLQSIGDAVLATDKAGFITRMNPIAEALTGWTLDEARGQPFACIVRLKSSLNGEPVSSPIARVIAEGRTIGLANHTTLTSRHGIERQIADSAAPIRDSDRTLLGVVMVFRDVTQDYATRAELEHSKRQLDLAIQSAELGIWDWDTKTRRITLAGQEGRLFGFPPEHREVSLEDFEARVHPEDWPPTMAAAGAAIETGSSFDCQFRVLHPGGEERWVRAIGRAVTDEETGRQHVMGTARDVTERKAEHERAQRTIDALIRSNAELERFAYVASHDLQEPIRTIVAYSQLLGQRHGDRLDGEAREFLDFIMEGGRRMQSLVLDLLDYSRVSTRGRPFAAVDLNHVVQAARENLRLAELDSHASVTVESLPMVSGDETQLVSLMQNLIGNAIKFHRPGVPPRVTVRAHREKAMHVIEVADNGVGIADGDLEKIFQLFKRLHALDEYPGTGVGLALAKRIVEHHGGRIGLDSTPGQGSVFRLHLPAPP